MRRWRASPRARLQVLAVSLVFLVLIGIRGLFAVTYPLNNVGGDTPNYYHMLIAGESSLVHPGGYPFLIGLPFRHWPFGPVKEGSATADVVILVLQHLLGLLSSVLLFWFTRELFGWVSGCVAGLMLGMNLQLLGATSSTYPEWFQATLLIVALATALRAFQRKGRRKFIWYLTSIVAATWCYLVKFNAAPLLVLYFVPLLAESARWRVKSVAVLSSIVVALLNVVIFEATFHFPSTDTYRLTMDTSWVLLAQIQQTYHNRLAPASGLATKRWLALAASLPQRYDQAGPGLFSRLDAVPGEIRSPYRPVYDRIAGTDGGSLDDWLLTHPLPDNFIVGLSSIPVAYFVGLREADDLGVQVALEAVAADPSTYVHSVLARARAVVTRSTFYPIFPLPSNMPAFDVRVVTRLSHGVVGLNSPPAPQNVPYAYASPRIWWPGVKVLEVLDRLMCFPAWAISIAMGFDVILSAWLLLIRRAWNTQAGLVILLATGLVVFGIASCMVLDFRWKEMCLAMPLVSILIGASVGWAPFELFGRRLRARPAPA